MCTVTVHCSPEALLVTMNRDEARTRGPELPPAIETAPGDTPWASPRDSEHGGTWFSVNTAGIVACLLNRYQDALALPPTAPRSRGKIIPALMASRSLEEIRDRLDPGVMDLPAYPAFTLLLATMERVERWDWRGAGELESQILDGPWTLVSSSLFEPETVLPWRERAFRAWLEDGASMTNGIPAYHLYQPPGMAACAPLMSREISCTRSITQAQVDRATGHCRLRYTPMVDGMPDWAQFARFLELPALDRGIPA
jgi:hypothetical protein